MEETRINNENGFRLYADRVDGDLEELSKSMESRRKAIDRFNEVGDGDPSLLG